MRWQIVTLILVILTLLMTASSPLPSGDGVVGYGVGPNGPVVFVEGPNTILPASMFEREVVITGKLYRLDMLDVPDTVYVDRYRPAFPGVSVGHYLITAGTLGSVVYDGGKTYILSNNHVLANSDGCKEGDAILQPGFYDGGRLSYDTIARLARWLPISRCNSSDLAADTCPQNIADVAIAEVINPTDVVDFNPPLQIMDAYLNQPVYFYGRTSGFSTGTVAYLAETVKVCCYSGNVAEFSNQILTNKMTQGGDSGSLLRDVSSGDAVGLFFAGSFYASVASPIRDALSIMCASFDPGHVCYRYRFPFMPR